MRFLIITLLVALALASQFVMPAASSQMSANNHSAIQTAEVPTTLLDGIDWDEWLERVTNPIMDWGSLFGYWTMLDGIDWDEWLENIGLLPPGTTPT